MKIILIVFVQFKNDNNYLNKPVVIKSSMLTETKFFSTMDNSRALGREELVTLLKYNGSNRMDPT